MFFFALLPMFWALGEGARLLLFSSKTLAAFKFQCSDLLPEDSTERAALLSLVCAEKVTEPELKQGLLDSGLLHLFVVSGSHLLFLTWILEKFRCPVALRLLLLLGYVALTGGEPPVLRAWIGTLLITLATPTGAAWRGDQRVLWTGLLTLAVCPDWISSLSLLLSWVAALGLTLGGGSLLRDSAIVHLLLWPYLGGWSTHPPLAILANAVLAPFLGGVLFPLALLTTLGSWALPPFEALMALFRFLLSLAPPAAAPVGERFLSLNAGWALLAFLHAVIHLHLTASRRQRSWRWRTT